MYKIILGRNATDRKKFEDLGTAFLGKHYVTMGQEKSLANPILLDIARPHIMLVCGKRGSGKSYTLGVIAEELACLPKGIKENVSCLIFDTLGIFWSMKYQNFRDSDSLKKWGLKPLKDMVSVFVPEKLRDIYEKKGLPVDYTFALKTSLLNAEDWCSIFRIDVNSEKGAAISNALSALGEEFSVQEIISYLESSKNIGDETRKQLISRFETVNNWGISEKQGVEIEALIPAGKTTVFDISAYSQFSEDTAIKNLVIEVICRQILKKRMAARKEEEITEILQGDLFSGKMKQDPLVWILIDEAHEFIPQEDTIASQGLKSILKEGRQPGISLVLATQQVGKLHPDALSQADIVISHRVTSKKDVLALKEIMQSYMPKELTLALNELPKVKGSAIVLDDSNEKIFPVQVRPRKTWHGGNDPSALRKVKELEEGENPFLKKIQEQISELKEID